MRLPLWIHPFIMSHCRGVPPLMSTRITVTAANPSVRQRSWFPEDDFNFDFSLVSQIWVKCLWVDKLKYLCCSFKIVVVLNHNGHEFPQSTEIKVSQAPQTHHFSTRLSSNQHSWLPCRLLNHPSPGHITACFEQSFNKHSSQGICAGLQLCLLWFLWICQGGWGTKHRLASFPVSHRASLLLQCERRPVGGSGDARLPAAVSVSVCEDKATPRGSSCECI